MIAAIAGGFAAVTAAAIAGEGAGVAFVLTFVLVGSLGLVVCAANRAHRAPPR